VPWTILPVLGFVNRVTTARATAADVRRHLASRASWLTVASFALLVGGAFVSSLTTLLDRSSQALSAPPPEPIFLATVRWLSHEKIVTIAPRAPQERTLTMDGAQRKTLIFFVVVLLPGLAAAAAASVRIRA